MQAIILAGGLGTRLRSVVSDRPKPMALVNNKPFLEHLIDNLVKYNYTEIILAVGYKYKYIFDYFNNINYENKNNIKLYYSIENQPLGTGGALLQAIDYIDNHDNNINKNILVLNGDSFLDIDYNNLKYNHINNNSELTIALRETNNCSRYTYIDIDIDLLNPKKIYKINNFLENQNKPGYINAGVYYFDLNILNKIKQNLIQNNIYNSNLSSLSILSLEQQLFKYYLDNNYKIYGYIVDKNKKFIDIGVPDAYHHANKYLEENFAQT